MLKLKELPEMERPYEKLELYGAEKLSNAELLGIIIKTGTKKENAVMLANRILSLNKQENSLYEKNDELKNLMNYTIEEFMSINGIGRVKSIQLSAMCELTKRMTSITKNRNIVIKKANDVVELFMEELRFEKKEKVKLVILNSKNNIIKILEVAQGGINFAMIDPKEILSSVLKTQNEKFILIHNHPSGDPTPSASDFEVTKRIREGAKLVGLELLDHIVIGDGDYRSIV